MFLRKGIYTKLDNTEAFTFSQIKNILLVTYLIKNYQNNPVSGCFYEEELTKVK